MKLCFSENNNYKFIVVLVIINIHCSVPFQLVGSNACVERCSSRISWRWKTWCSLNCPTNSPKPSSLSFITSFTTRTRKNIITFKKKLEPEPDWEKVTIDPRTPSTPSLTTKRKITPPVKVITTTINNEKTTKETATVTKKTRSNTTKSRITYIYVRVGNKEELERAIQKSIDEQNTAFKLVLATVGVCLVVGVLIFVVRSLLCTMKKPNRVSFTDDPIILVHNNMAQ